MASQLKSYPLTSFKDGYNSFPASKTQVKDTEIPYGLNVQTSDVGSIRKVNGKTRFGPEVESGYALRGAGVLKNSTYNAIIVAAKTSWYKLTDSTKAALTGKTFSSDKRTNFCQAFDKLYGANNVDNLCYTADAGAVTEISSNGNVGDWPCFFNQRIYMTNATYPDRVYYSNPYSLDLSTNPPTLTGFSDANMFNTDLTATPKKNAGYIVLLPGGGVEITRLLVDNTDIFAYTKRHGVWKITPVATVNSDGSIAHTVTTVITQGGIPSGLAAAKVANDQWYYGGDNLYSYGELAYYQSPRRATKSGRIRTEINSITSGGKSTAALGYYMDNVFFAYRTGSYNDRVIKFDVILNAFSPPMTFINANFFLNWKDDNGNDRFFAGSSNSADSYLYELETGTDSQGAAITGVFETKSTDCDLPGLIKRFAFIDVFYGTIYGALTYEVFIDENEPLTGTVQIGNSSDKPAGLGSLPIGTFPIGAEYDPDTTFASLSQNDSFRIDCGYVDGKKISVRFTNANTGEQFQINSINVWFKPGNVNEQ